MHFQLEFLFGCKSMSLLRIWFPGPIQQHPITILAMVIAMDDHPNAILSAKGRPKEKKTRRGFKHIPKIATMMLG